MDVDSPGDEGEEESGPGDDGNKQRRERGRAVDRALGKDAQAVA